METFTQLGGPPSGSIRAFPKRVPGTSIPQGGSARLGKVNVARRIAEKLYVLTDSAKRRAAGKKAGDRVLATWREMLKQYQKVHATISGTGFGIGRDDRVRGIKSIEQYKEHYCCFYNRLDAVQQPAAMHVGVYHSIPITHRLSPVVDASEASLENEGQERISSSPSPKAVTDHFLASHMSHPENETEDGDVVEESEDEDELDRSRPPAKRSFTSAKNRFTEHVELEWEKFKFQKQTAREQLEQDKRKSDRQYFIEGERAQNERV
ncbi:hypothetical protein BX666DRAFT_2108859 [Dichotomocladium elegans]|nr:hypothetical protein BX666DRAFT_2108859 [Dichotomocladium elegans]